MSQSSILDTRITIPEAPRTVDQMLEAISQAVTEAAHLRFAIINMGGLRSIPPPTAVLGCQDCAARDLLTRTLQTFGWHAVWHIYYAPDARFKALNLRWLPDAR